MRKFWNLLKKETKELINAQLIISLIFTLSLFYLFGTLAQGEMKKAEAPQEIAVLDLDSSDLSRGVTSGLSAANFKIISLQSTEREKALEEARNSGASLFLVIPQGFGKSVLEMNSVPIETYYFIKGFSISTVSTSGVVKTVLGAINDYVSNSYLSEKIPGVNPEELKNPVKNKDFVVVREKVAEGSPAEVSSFIQSQSIFIPIILMMIIVYSSQMMISAVAMEKENKTLETLLTVPINRNYIVVAKMLSSGIVGLVTAGIYMVGFRFYMSGFMGNVPTSGQIDTVVQKLGLAFTPQGYLVLGVSLFLAILCGLAMAIILGVLAKDLKSAQGLLMPITFLALIPYFISLFSDFNSLSWPVKVLLWIIPFSHPFLASQNILLGNYPPVFYGIVYMFVVFAILVFLAARIFSSDQVLTMKLQLSRRSLKGIKQ
ncbi:MAG: ABC transporter permease [Coprothermobacterota bacterium]|nr:ABC transporter permease [Coprothermobacterota bacterium]